MFGKRLVGVFVFCGCRSDLILVASWYDGGLIKEEGFVILVQRKMCGFRCGIEGDGFRGV
jgi:hypothetical protein